MKEYWMWDYRSQRYIKAPGVNVHRDGCVTADEGEVDAKE